ncbi:hypothetical protein GQ600_16944 [Phytophthora cactorum]|nr:hypothetical protein GQ600_16944 [Phytophthora cactorum]
MHYLENARPEDFTYDNHVLAFKKKLDDPKFQHAALHTTALTMDAGRRSRSA